MPVKYLAYRAMLALLFSLIAPKVLSEHGRSLSVQQHKNHFFINLTAGFGSTDWAALIPEDPKDPAIFATPLAAVDTGLVYGLGIGRYFSENFTLSLNFTQFPDSLITLHDSSFYNPIKQFNSKTQVYSLLGQFIVPIANSRFAAFASAGVSLVHRCDILALTQWGLGPGFGAGIIFYIQQHWQTQINFDYYTGHGVSESLPIHHYMPFLYSLQGELIYVF